MTQDAATLIQIGQLLTKSGILTSEDLAEALIRSKERGLPLGTVLLMLGYIRQRELRAAVEAQSLVNDGLLSVETAVRALILVYADGGDLSESLTELGWENKREIATNKLGELLQDAEFLTGEELAECLSTSQETGMPLGKVLIFRKTLSDSVLLAVLSAQRMIREGLVSRDQALKGLKAVRLRKITLEQSLAEGGFYKPPSRKNTPLGYLLVEAGFLKEASLMMCMELSLTEEKPLGDALVEQGFVSRALLDSAIMAQEMVDNGTFTKKLAASAIRLVEVDGCSMVRAIAQAGMPELTPKRKDLLNELLVLAGVVEPKDMPKLEQSAFKDFAQLLEKLLATGMIEEPMIYAVVRSLYLIDQKFLVPEDAVMALHHCRRHHTTLDEALREMGWTVPTRRKS